MNSPASLRQSSRSTGVKSILFFLLIVSVFVSAVFLVIKLVLSFGSNIKTNTPEASLIPSAEAVGMVKGLASVFDINLEGNFNKPANFNDTTNFSKRAQLLGGLITQNADADFGTGNITAGNVVYRINAGSGILVSGGQNPTISLAQQVPTITVLSVQGKTGSIKFTAGSGIAISGLEISNDDPGSAQNIFKNVAVTGQNTVVAGGNDDTLTFVPGAGIDLTTDATGKSITITNSNFTSNVSGWSRTGTNVALSFIDDLVGIGTSSPAYKLDVAGDIRLGNNSTLYLGNIALGGVGTSAITSGAYKVGVYDNLTYSNSANVQAVLKDIDNALVALYAISGITSPAPSGALLVGNGTGFITQFMSGDATMAADGVLSLANSGVTSGTYGSILGIPVLSVDVKGRIISASTAALNLTFENPLTISNGLSRVGNTITVDGSTTGTTSTTASNSGLEVSADGVRLLGGCANNEFLMWNSGNETWACVSLNGVGAITGSGTPNYLARFSGANTLTTGSIYDNGSAVGIGTTDPGSNLLAVAGNASFTGRVSAQYLDRWFQVPLLTQAYEGKTTSVTVGGVPRGIAFDGNYIWTANGSANTVTKIDIFTNSVVSTLADTSISEPGGILYADSHIWVTGINGFLTKINPVSNTVVASSNIGASNCGMGYDGSKLWVSRPATSDVAKVNPATLSIEATIPVGTGPCYFTFDGTNMWVTSGTSNTVSKLDINANTEVARYPVGGGPLGITYDGSYIWVANDSTNSFTKIRPSDGALIADIPSGSFPLGMAFDGNYVWGVNFVSNSLTVIDPRTNSVVQTLSGTYVGGGNPHSIAFDGHNMWVSNSSIGAATKVRLSASASNITNVRNQFSVGSSSSTALLSVIPTEYFLRVFYYNGSAYTTNTTEARTTGGTPFTLLASTSDYTYVGKYVPFSTIYLGLGSTSAGTTLTAEYWNGTAWTALTFTDGTNNLNRNGSITYTSPTDWSQTTVNGNSGYYVRLGTSTIPTTVATAYVLTPSNKDSFRVYSQISDTAPAFSITQDGYLGLGTTNPLSKFHMTSGNMELDGGRINFDSTDNNYQMGMGINMGGVAMGIRNAQSGVGIFSMTDYITQVHSGDMYLRLGFGTPRDFIIEDYDGAGERFIVKGTGNVGIGTTVPSYKLDVAGDIRIANGSDLILGSILLGGTGSSNTTSGAYKVGSFDEFDYSTGITVQSVLKDFDTQIGLLYSAVGGTAPSHTPVSLTTNGYNYLSLATVSQTLTMSAVSLTTDVSGVLMAANGGTGFNAGTAPVGSLLIGNGSGFSLSALSGDATVASNGTLSLADSGVSAGTYGSTIGIPIITVDSKGRITSASTSPISSGGVVFGSGTPNYLARFSNANTLVSGTIYDDGTNVSIGTTSPVAQLGVVASLSTLNDHYTNLASWIYLAESAASNKNVNAMINGVQYSGTSPVQSLMGIDDSAWNMNNATVEWIRGGILRAINYGTVSTAMYGNSGEVENRGSGSVAEAYSSRVKLTNSGGGSIPIGALVRASAYNTSGTINNLYGLLLNTWTNSGTVTNSYGIYMDSSIDVGNQRWALYSASNSNSYFAGNLGIGVTSPLNKLDVAGGMVLGSGYAQQALAPTNGLLVQGKVGIGTTNPTYMLDVVAPGSVLGGRFRYDSAAGRPELSLNVGIAGGMINVSSAAAGSGLYLSIDMAHKLVVGASGNVGIGSDLTPDYFFDVQGVANIDSDVYLASVSGNVGIGTTNPSASLHIVSPTASSLRIEGTSSSGWNSSVDLLESDGNHGLSWYIDGLHDTGLLRTRLSGVNTDVMSFPYNAGAVYVGIGTTAPAAPLHITGGTGTIERLQSSGGYTFDLGWSGTDFIYRNNTSAWHRFYAGATNLFNLADQEAWLPVTNARLGVGKRTAAGEQFGVSYDGTNWDFLINSSGSVGIGVTNPLEKLQIGNGSIYLDNTYGLVWDASSEYIKRITNDKLVFGTTNNDRMLIDANGNVGIGTTSPNATLDILKNGGTFRIGGSANNYFGIEDGTDSDRTTIHSINRAYINFEQGSGAQGPIWFRLWPDTRLGIGNSVPNATLDIRNQGTENIFQAYDATTPVFTILDGGNVGIGTTNPQHNLSLPNNGVFGTDADGGTISFVNIGSGGNTFQLSGNQMNLGSHIGYFKFVRDATAASTTNGFAFQVGMGGNPASIWQPLTNSTTALQLANSSGSAVMNIDTLNTYVGIGTTAPMLSLDINGATYARSGIKTTQIDSSWIGAGTDLTLSSGGSGNLIFKNGASEAMRINSSGRVGLGITNPQQILQVATNSNIAPYIAVSRSATVPADPSGDNYTPYGGIRFYSTAINNAYTNYYSGIEGTQYNGIDSSGLNFYTANNATSQIAMTLTDTGRLGIGTSNPTSLLEINAPNMSYAFGVYDQGYYPFFVDTASDVAGMQASVPGGSTTFKLQNVYPGGQGTKLSFYSRENFGGNNVLEAGSIQSAAEGAWTATSNVSSYLAFSTISGSTAAERLRISAAGNVGIGITNPAAKLQVAGNIIIGDGTAATTSLTFRSLNDNTNANINSNGGLNIIGPDQASATHVNIKTAVNSTDNINFYPGGVNYVTFYGTGNAYFANNIGIGTTLPAYRLDVSGVVRAQDVLTQELVLGSSGYSNLSAIKGFSGYTNFSGGVGTGGFDSLLASQRITSSGNLVNVGSIQAGEVLLTAGGTFGSGRTYPSLGSNIMRSFAADISGDGKPDLLGINFSSNNIVTYINNGDGTFGQSATFSSLGTSPMRITAGDLNGDARADLVVTNYNSNSITLLMNNGSGTFSSGTTYPSFGINTHTPYLADINGDGKLDVLATNSATNSFVTYMNRGDGTLSVGRTYPSLGTQTEDIIATDINGDGKPDVVLGNNGSDNFATYINNGDGTFGNGATYSSLGTGTNFKKLSVADFSGDGKVDIALVNSSSDSIATYVNNGDGTFGSGRTYPALGTLVEGVALGDVNGDGNADMVSVNYSSASIVTYLNTGTGGFVGSGTTYPVNGAGSHGPTLIDLNGDGKLDIVGANQASSNFFVFLNQSRPILAARASNGFVGLGMTNPSVMLDVTGDIEYTGTITDVSDARLKENITPITSSLQKILALKGYSFNMIGSSQEELGFLAQDVQQVIPEAVKVVDPTNGYLGVNYMAFIPVLSEAVKEQNTQYTQLVDRMAFVESLLNINSETSSSTSSRESSSSFGGVAGGLSNLLSSIFDTLQSLNISSTNGALNVNTDLNVLGNTTLNDVTVLSDITIGSVRISSLDNSVDVLGASCYNPDTNDHNKTLCDSQTLYVQKEMAGNINMFDGRVVIEPDGTATFLGTVKAKAVEVESIIIKSANNDSAILGGGVIKKGDTFATINTKSVKSNSRIFVTPSSSANGQSLVAYDKVEGESFKVSIDAPLDKDVTFDWWILNVE